MMLFLLYKGDRLVGTTDRNPFTGTPALRTIPGIEYDTVKDRWDWKSLDEVTGLALYVTAMTGKQYIGVDAGPGVSPRFDIVEPPKVGDEVSYGFNGDYYPCGVITEITKNWMVKTSEGKRFNRRKNSGSWVMVGGTWSLVPGHITEQNPHF